ncbi:hypothetical protein LPJ64_003787 [Coemansia asiatica]|uniref:Glycerol-3-phosphatase n=1 Tax=Coemansia asiatica TaxID=1052880 RepID=A0A9W8CIG5_9FUNG|nr:hypothetical protein LPJ64_003787 [Coemansia asiatica]
MSTVIIKAKAILFDMDGTLVNTVACVETYWRGMAAKYNVDAEKLLHNVHGHPTYDVLCKWFPESMHTREHAEKAERDLMNDAEGVFAVPGVPELLSKLDPKKWTIVTAATQALALTRLQQVNLPIPETLVSAKDAHAGKPNPDCYQMGAKRLGVVPKDTVVFEDAINGVKAGCAAGATVVGVLTSTTEDKLRQSGAQHIVSDFSNVRVEDKGDYVEITIG